MRRLPALPPNKEPRAAAIVDIDWKLADDSHFSSRRSAPEKELRMLSDQELAFGYGRAVGTRIPSRRSELKRSLESSFVGEIGCRRCWGRRRRMKWFHLSVCPVLRLRPGRHVIRQGEQQWIGKRSSTARCFNYGASKPDKLPIQMTSLSSMLPVPTTQGPGTNKFDRAPSLACTASHGITQEYVWSFEQSHH